MKKKILSIVLIGLCCLLMITSKKEENILYSWKMDALEDKELLDIIKKYNIKEIYQDFSTEYLTQNDSKFLKKMKEKGVKVYQLCGDPSWGLDKKATSMKREIDKVISYNKKNEEQIAGIVFDVEPYLHNEENFDFPLFTESMKEAYRYAKKQNLYLILALPVWLDSIDKNLLEDIIKEGCDEISLMNYNIKYTKENIETEIEYAKKYQKKVNTIYEVYSEEQDYFKTDKEINQDFKKIRNHYHYDKLRKAYHYYEKMKQN